MLNMDGNLGIFLVSFYLRSFGLCAPAVCVAYVWLEFNAGRWFFCGFARSVCIVTIGWKSNLTTWC
jgi:hypothetical protein